MYQIAEGFVACSTSSRRHKLVKLTFPVFDVDIAILYFRQRDICNESLYIFGNEVKAMVI